MGVVYEAMQLSLGRKVAVKVLPFVASLDPSICSDSKTKLVRRQHSTMTSFPSMRWALNGAFISTRCN